MKAPSDLTDAECSAILRAAATLCPDVLDRARERMTESAARDVQRALGAFACIVCGRQSCPREH
jgi:hypothetical protein